MCEYQVQSKQNNQKVMDPNQSGKPSNSSEAVFPQTKTQESSLNRQKKDSKIKTLRQFRTTNESQRTHWNSIEQSRYIKFLVKYEELFYESFDVKKRKRIYVKMAKAIIVRNQEQCRSHHQKMLVKFKSIQTIINNHQNLFLQGSSNMKGLQQHRVQYLEEHQDLAHQFNDSQQETNSETESLSRSFQNALSRFNLVDEDQSQMQEKREREPEIEKQSHQDQISFSSCPFIAIPASENIHSSEFIYFNNGEVYMMTSPFENKTQRKG